MTRSASWISLRRFRLRLSWWSYRRMRVAGACRKCYVNRTIVRTRGRVCRFRGHRRRFCRGGGGAGFQGATPLFNFFRAWVYILPGSNFLGPPTFLRIFPTYCFFDFSGNILPGAISRCFSPCKIFSDNARIKHYFNEICGFCANMAIILYEIRI